ncbi:RNA-guided endonuclease IscB [Vibrio alfacsensis]|uniref:RNA-guided endonuclease IscB n=1 Tax=Vibrio alfacsensis TaxID=1074311 RepID=UPI004067D06E
MRVFVLSKNSTPLMPCNPARARMLLKAKEAFIKKRAPFTIQLLKSTSSYAQPIDYKVDPGSKKTGVAIVLHGARYHKLIFAMVIEHRGQQVVKNLKKRREHRRFRRSKLRYREARFMNRRASRSNRPPPSLISMLSNHQTWFKRICALAPVSSVVLEHVKFDTQLIDNPNIEGKEYQQGPLYQENLWQYLLVRDMHRCRLCLGASGDSFLTKEHNVPVKQGGSNSVTNLCVACSSCNQHKGNRTLEQYLDFLQSGQKNKLNKARIVAVSKLIDTKVLKASSRHNAVMNQLRWKLLAIYKEDGMPVSCSTGAQTALNRKKLGMNKEHWLDAALTGAQGDKVKLPDLVQVMEVRAFQRSGRQMVDIDKYGFPRSKPRQPRKKFGGVLYQSGDLVKVNYTGNKVPRGIYIGSIRSYRQSGSFTIASDDIQFNAHWKNVQKLKSNDGYKYGWVTQDSRCDNKA